MTFRSLMLAVVASAIFATPARAAVLTVDGAQSACSDSRPATQNTPTTPWCSLTPAAGLAQPGDEIRIAPGIYRGTFRPLTSGTATQPIRIVASAPGVTLDGSGAANTLKFISVSNWTVEGVTVTGGVNQGVWADSTTAITLDKVSVLSNPGAGVQLKNAASTVVTGATISENGSAGVLELAGSTGTRVDESTITGNGRGTSAYNGDGIQLAGAGAAITGNTITGNGSSTFEHGVYAAGSSSGWAIERNTITANFGAGVKASGSGTVRYNRFVDGTFGLVLAANTTPVDVAENVLTGSAQHLVFVTTGGQGRLHANTIRQTGRAAASGDASALFVNEGVSLELRNNIACYDGADDLGVGLWINNPAKLGEFTSDTNWYCSRDTRGRAVASAGSRTDAAAWRTAFPGADARSVFSGPPLFDADGRALSPQLGAGAGDPLTTVTTDFAGVPWPQTGAWDIGAYRAEAATPTPTPTPTPDCG